MAERRRGVFGDPRYSTAYRQFMFDNRDRVKAQASVAVDLLRNLTLTPTVAVRDDDYRLNPATEVGLQFDRTTSAGVELVWVASPYTRFLVSYMHDLQKQSISSAGQSVPPFPANQYYTAQVVDTVNTYLAAVTHAVIPNALDVTLSYTYVRSNNSQPLIFANGTGPSASTGGQYPDVRGSYQRLEAMAKYTFDEGLVRRLGWNGKVFARVRYVWERNSVENWQNDIMQTYMYSAVTRHQLHDLAGLGQSQLQRSHDRRIARFRLVKCDGALSRNGCGGARVRLQVRLRLTEPEGPRGHHAWANASP